MNTLIYLLAAGFCLGLSLRTWAEERRDPVRRAFMLLGLVCGIMYAGFAVFLLPGMTMARYLQSGVVAFLPAALLGFLDRLLVDAHAPASPAARRMWALAPLVSVSFLVTDIVFFGDVPRGSPPEVLLGIYVYGGLLLSVARLYEHLRGAQTRVERARLRYLLVLCCCAVGFSLLEDLLRGLGPAPDVTAPGLANRATELQGILPPLGAAATTLFVYLLHQVVQLTRLLDLHEIFSRMFTLAVAGLLLVVVDGVAVIWLGGLSTNPVHGTFQIFLASVLFLALYDPLRLRIEALASQWFNRRGRLLEQSLVEIDGQLARTISLEGIDRALLAGLQSSGRVPLVSLYLRDPDTGLYRLTIQKGQTEQVLMRTISARPFTEGFQKGQRAYVRPDLEHLVRRQGPGHEEAAARLRTLESMDADLVIGIMSGEYVLGWLALKDEAWSDGFSQDEVRRLTETVNRATHVLENISAVESVKEQHRLAALGTMAAGLAHEIRNPLAGIKGAAQYLEGERDPEVLRDFLEVIVSETNRLNGVVDQFLHYSRPFALSAEPTDVNRLVDRTLALVRAQDLLPGITLRASPDPALPAVEVDADKVRQVLLNLVHNAVQALAQAPGGAGGTVEVRTGRTRLRGRDGLITDAVEIAVHDDGPGIAPEDLDQLFIPFFTTRQDGTGLGLPISRRLVEAHGGELLVRSNPGEGATFYVRLPVAQERSPSLPGVPRPRLATRDAAAG